MPPTLITLPQFALNFQTKNARKTTGSDQRTGNGITLEHPRSTS